MIEGKNLDQAKRHPDVVKNQIKQNGRRERTDVVTSVNGQTGDATLDAASVGAVAKAGDTMTGNLFVAKAGNAYVQAENKNTGVKLNLDTGSGQTHGIWTYGYYDGSAFHSDGKWMIYRDYAGTVVVNGKAENVTGTVAVANGGTGAVSAAAANANLHNYNLLEGVQLSYNTDLNTIVTPNIYRTTSDSNTASLVNKPPVTQPFQLAVMYIHGNYAVMQHVNEWLTGNEWRRFGYISGGSWTWVAWEQVLTATNLNDAIVVEEVLVTSGGSSTTYYKEFTKTVSKSGYTAAGLAGYRWNQVALLCYRATVNNGEIRLGLAKASGSGALSSINAYASVLWVRNDMV